MFLIWTYLLTMSQDGIIIIASNTLKFSSLVSLCSLLTSLSHLDPYSFDLQDIILLVSVLVLIYLLKDK